MGANGAAGGSVDLIFDSRFPDLQRMVVLEAPGGEAGAPGSAGEGGSGGSGGSGTGQGGKNGAQGPRERMAHREAPAGAAPTARVREGGLGHRAVRGLGEGIALLGEPGPAVTTATAEPAADVKDPKTMKGKPTEKASGAKAAKKKQKQAK